MSFTPIAITAQFLDSTGAVIKRGTVEFELTASMTQPGQKVSPHVIRGILDPATGNLKLDSGQVLSLLATDDIGTSPSGVTYTVTERISDSPVNTWQLSVPHNSPGGTLDLSSVAPSINNPLYSYASTTGTTFTGPIIHASSSPIDAQAGVKLHGLARSAVPVGTIHGPLGDVIIPPPGPLVPQTPNVIAIDATYSTHLGCPGLRNDVWFSMTLSGSPGKLGHYDAGTKVYTSFQMPTPPSTFSPAGIVCSPLDGHIYIASQGADGLWTYDPIANAWTNPGMPAGISGGIDRLYLNPSTGNVFTCWTNPTGTYSADGVVFAEFVVSTQTWRIINYSQNLTSDFATYGTYTIPISAQQFHIFPGDDGLIWEMMTYFNAWIVMVAFDPVTYLPVYVSPNAPTYPAGVAEGLFSFTCDGLDGYGYMSFNDSGSGTPYIVRVAKDGSSIRAYPTGTGTYPDQVNIGIDRRIWSTDFANSQLLALDPVSGVVTPYTYSNTALSCVGVFAGPDGSIYGTATGLVQIPLISSGGGVTSLAVNGGAPGTGPLSLVADPGLGVGEKCTIICAGLKTVIQGTWVDEPFSSTWYGGFVYNTSDALNDEIQYAKWLAAGTYKLMIYGNSETNGGQLSLIVNGATQSGVYDTYASTGGTSSNTWTGVVLPSSGLVTIGLKVTGTNASSGYYYCRLSGFDIMRTA